MLMNNTIEKLGIFAISGLPMKIVRTGAAAWRITQN